MSNLVVIGYENQMKAEEVRLTLLKLQKDFLIDIEDAVVAVRELNGKVKLRQLVSMTAVGASRGGFWGSLVGLLFLNPLFGLAVGAASGAISGALTDVGIDDKFMKNLASTLTPGTAALCVLVRKATVDKVLDEVGKYGGKILQSSISHEDEAKLQNALDLAQAATA